MEVFARIMTSLAAEAALVVRRRAANESCRNRGAATTAAGTSRQAGEEILRSAPIVHPAYVGCAALVPFGPHFALAGFHGVPDVVIEDAQLGRFLNDPFQFRVGPCLTLAG